MAGVGLVGLGRYAFYAGLGCNIVGLKCKMVVTICKVSVVDAIDRTGESME